MWNIEKKKKKQDSKRAIKLNNKGLLATLFFYKIMQPPLNIFPETSNTTYLNFQQLCIYCTEKQKP